MFNDGFDDYGSNVVVLLENILNWAVSLNGM